MCDCLRARICACTDNNVYVFSLLHAMPPPPLPTPPSGVAKLPWKVWEHFALTNRGKSITSRLRVPLSIWGRVDAAFLFSPRGAEREGVRVEVIALQALKCPVVLRTLGGHCATQLQSSGEGRARGWGRAERSHKRLSCKYKSLLAPEQRVQSSWTGFCFSLVLAPCQSAFCTERLGTLINLWQIPHRPDRERWILKNTMTLSHYNSK